MEAHGGIRDHVTASRSMSRGNINLAHSASLTVGGSTYDLHFHALVKRYIFVLVLSICSDHCLLDYIPFFLVLLPFEH